MIIQSAINVYIALTTVPYLYINLTDYDRKSILAMERNYVCWTPDSFKMNHSFGEKQLVCAIYNFVWISNFPFMRIESDFV